MKYMKEIKSFKIIMLVSFLIFGLLGLSGCSKKEPRTIVVIGDSLTACGGADGKYTDYLQEWLPIHFIIPIVLNLRDAIRKILFGAF